MGAKLFALAFVLSSAAAPAAAAADDRVKKLSEEHRQWLERDVLYIITDREKDVFLTLETQEERTRFIEAFWRKRDPNPATPVNEYKEEHYRRIEYANTRLGRETFREGWRTDRGRFYILLGEPREVQRYDGYAEVVSCELWFYQGEPNLGVPAFFYLLFFKKNDFGEYQLYHPLIDSPFALLTPSVNLAGGRGENIEAVQALRQISPELAAASLSFDTSEPPDYMGGRPALGTDIMIARIEDSPKRAIRTDYAEAWLRYGNRVSADYSFNFVPSRSTFAVLAESSGTPVVHFSIELEPQNFTMETDEEQSKFYTTLDVTLEARDPEGVLILASDKEVYLELTPSQVQAIRTSPFSYQDNFPLVPGDYSITVILRNRVITQYTVAERELTVPVPDSARPSLMDVVLAYESKNVVGEVADDEMRTFQLGGFRFQPAAESVFVIGETVHLVSQAFGATPRHRVMFELVEGDKVLKSIESPVADNGMVFDHLSLENMVGGSFEVRARLLSPDGEELSRKSVPITVSPRSVATRPSFIYRRGFNFNVPGLIPLVKGEQLWNLQKFDEARGELEKAVAAENPQLPAARWLLANAYLRDKRADEALALLRPLEADFGSQFEVVAGLGFALYLKSDFQNAVGYLERARQIRPPDRLLLNALGDSHQQLGQMKEAREAFERSIELDPDQPEVKERLEALGAATPPAER